jgi:hypothetical protein
MDLARDLHDGPARTAGILVVAAGQPNALGREQNKPCGTLSTSLSHAPQTASWLATSTLKVPATSPAPSRRRRRRGPNDSGHAACKHYAGSRSCDLPVISQGSLYSLYPN